MDFKKIKEKLKLCLKKIMHDYFAITIVIFAIINLTLNLWYTSKNNKYEKELATKSIFSYVMYKEKKIGMFPSTNDYFNFIKTAENELKNLDRYLDKYSIEKNEKLSSLYYFLVLQKACLQKEIDEKKLYIYCKRDKLKNIPDSYKTYATLYPEKVKKYEQEGKLLDYTKIDYIKWYHNNVGSTDDIVELLKENEL